MAHADEHQDDQCELSPHYQYFRYSFYSLDHGSGKQIQSDLPFTGMLINKSGDTHLMLPSESFNPNRTGGGGADAPPLCFLTATAKRLKQLN